MTAYLSASYQPLSALTVQSLRDLGYTVDGSSADEFIVSKDGYDTPGVPLPGDVPITPSWFDFDSSSFWNSTTIWIISCVGAAIIVVLISCIYSKMQRRGAVRPPKRRPSPPSAMSSMPRNGTSVPAPAYQSQQEYAPNAIPVRMPQGSFHNAPVAIPVAYPAVPSRENNIAIFMEITQCRDRLIAGNFLHEADGNVALAVDRYLENRDRRVALI